MERLLTTGLHTGICAISAPICDGVRTLQSETAMAPEGAPRPVGACVCDAPEASVQKVVRQLKAGLRQAWYKGEAEDIAAVDFGFDAEARKAFWLEMEEPVDSLCARNAKKVLIANDRHKVISESRRRMIAALVDAALVRILNGHSLEQSHRAREILWGRYEARIEKMAKSFERTAEREGSSWEDLRSQAYMHLFLDKGEKSPAKVRLYNPSFAGRAEKKDGSRRFATLATFIDYVVRNYFIQETRNRRRYSNAHKSLPGQRQFSEAKSHSQLVEEIADHVMSSSELGGQLSSRSVRTFLQNQSSTGLRQALKNDAELCKVMNRLPVKLRTFASISKCSSCKNDDEDFDTWAVCEYRAAFSRYKQDQREQQFSELGGVLDRILMRLREENPPQRRRGETPIDKVELFEKYWFHSMKLDAIRIQVRRSIGYVHCAIKKVEARFKQIILQDHPEVVLMLGLRSSRDPGLFC